MKPRYTAETTQIQSAASAKAVGLRYVSGAQPGIRRVKAGAGFRYTTAAGLPVRDERTLKRIRSLAVPPAWTDVWICPQEDGHLQATGRDAKGRKQHRYHPLWRDVRDATKYDHMIDFARALPRIRKRITRDIASAGLSREKVLATVVRLLDLTFIRVGNEEYAKNNRSYGLTTMKDRHADVRGETIRFQFRGKSGKCHDIEIEDKRLARIVKHCQDIPGQELFQYINQRGERCDVTSGDVNEYLREISGADFTAKDFRTWAGTVLATEALKQTDAFHTQKQAKKNIAQAIERVAEQLGNTPAVCRKCYVHPFVIDGYVKRRLPCNGRATPRNGEQTIRASTRPAASLGHDEQEVFEFLRCCQREERKKERQLKPRLTKVPAAWHPRVVRGMRVGHR